MDENSDERLFREALEVGGTDPSQRDFWYWLAIALHLVHHPEDWSSWERIQQPRANSLELSHTINESLEKFPEIRLVDDTALERILQDFPSILSTGNDLLKNPSTWTALGKILMETANRKVNVQTAIAAYKQAVSLDSMLDSAWLGLGYAYLKTRNYGEARKAYEMACQHNGKDAQAWYYLGLCLFGEKAYERAAQACQTALTLDPSIDPTHILLKNIQRLQENPANTPQNAIFLDDTEEPYPPGIIGEMLPDDWNCANVVIKNFIDDPTCLKITFLRINHPPDKRNVPPEFSRFAEDNYDYEGMRALIPRGWKFEYDVDAESFYIDIYDEKVPRAEKIALLGKLIEYHHREVERLAELYFDEHFSKEERAHYRTYFGFDPAADRYYPYGTYLDDKMAGGDNPDDAVPGEKYRYEAWFPLAMDPKLNEAGIRIGARVTVCDTWIEETETWDESKEKVHNEILFQKGNATGRVECTHTIIYAGPLDDALAVADDALTQNSRGSRQPQPQNANLPPPEHFAALKSYVASIAEMGVECLLHAAWHGIDEDNAESLGIPFGFNAAMQVQVFRALLEVSPSTSTAILADWVVDLLDNAPAEWFFTRAYIFREMLEEIFSHEIERSLFSHLKSISGYLEKHVSKEWSELHKKELKILFGYDFS